MNKKYKNRRRPQKKAISPLILLIGGGLLLVAAAMSIVFGNGDAGTPALAVDQEVIEYGDVKFETDLTFAIKVTNAGDGTLRFKGEPYIEVREGC
jgi:hypothetical protein